LTQNKAWGPGYLDAGDAVVGGQLLLYVGEGGGDHFLQEHNVRPFFLDDPAQANQSENSVIYVQVRKLTDKLTNN
jgi:hypothetical protein